MNVGFNLIFVISTAAVNVFLHFHVFTHNLSPLSCIYKPCGGIYCALILPDPLCPKASEAIVTLT